MDISRTMKIAASGLEAEATRLKVVSENLANANTGASTPGGLPYERKVVTFTDVLNRKLNADLVEVSGIKTATGNFRRHYDPSNPAAGSDGYVLMPNVNPLIELMDMRDAERSYEANLDVITAAKSMINHTIDLLNA